MYPEIPLPPKPILTRWGTWLEAVEYYAEHIDSINNVLLALDSEDAVSIDTAKTVTCDISVKNDLAHIQHTFSCIIKTLKSLQNRHLSLSESFEIINSTVEQLNRGRGKVADAVRAKVDTVLSKTLDMKNYKGCCCDEWVDGNYNAQGKLGAAVLGNAASRVYQLLLYKGKQQHVTSTRITPAFQFVVQANNYATFYDDQMQNWSIMFENNEDAVEFAKEIGLARSNSAGEQSDHNFITQDLLFGVGFGACEGDSVEIRYIVYPLSAGKIGQTSHNGWGDHHANHTIPPFWLDDSPHLLQHVDVRPAAG
ncbi:hypothetical protein ANN_26265 [Periplaneta americana]|uniref:Uncharacterized protein n=1 Tax=Periplaneta americana TaxID=6978 RepID=A0ABQ8S5S4_PERAM|nr:hypothetical protein ANN_26265 [Periplaneta americana]